MDVLSNVNYSTSTHHLASSWCCASNWIYYRIFWTSWWCLSAKIIAQNFRDLRKISLIIPAFQSLGVVFVSSWPFWHLRMLSNSKLRFPTKNDKLETRLNFICIATWYLSLLYKISFTFLISLTIQVETVKNSN